ncbi:MAG: hypothetical protein BWY09_02790 [Candidatus Hydrogenedentes bacterium ADurb.Bin179]|nr:MAG: hypothetical protein BWY09_02790 [Candidatus Hydrogenedentes bacterium ADurb.Bin179]
MNGAPGEHLETDPGLCHRSHKGDGFLREQVKDVVMVGVVVVLIGPDDGELTAILPGVS